MDDGGISVYFSLIHSKGVLCFLWLLSVIIFFLLSCLMCTCLELGCSELSCFAYKINSSFQTAVSSFYTTHFSWPFSLATTPVMWCRMCLKHYLYHFLFTVKVKITANNQFQTPPARHYVFMHRLPHSTLTGSTWGITSDILISVSILKTTATSPTVMLMIRARADIEVQVS